MVGIQEYNTVARDTQFEVVNIVGDWRDGVVSDVQQGIVISEHGRGSTVQTSDKVLTIHILSFQKLFIENEAKSIFVYNGFYVVAAENEIGFRIRIFNVWCRCCGRGIIGLQMGERTYQENAKGCDRANGNQKSLSDTKPVPEIPARRRFFLPIDGF